MKSKSMRLLLLALPSLAIACQPTLTTRTPGTGGSGGAGGGAAGSDVAGTTGASGDSSTGDSGTNGTAGVGAAGVQGVAGSGSSGTTPDAAATADGAAGTGAAGTSTVDESVMGIFGIKNQYMDDVADSFILFPCYSNSAQDCITNAPGTQCPSTAGKTFEEAGLVIDQDFKLGGVPGKMYTATIQVNGISEGKYYENGTRAAGLLDPPNANSDTGTDTWYTGGDPVPLENYNVYGIRSKDMTGNILFHYYLNSFPKTNTAYETHTTFAISYTHDITVMGGGTITYHSSDFNCHAIDNCGSGYRTVDCDVNAGRKVPNEPNLVVPTTYLGMPVSAFNARNGANQPYHSHIIHITVLSVKPM